MFGRLFILAIIFVGVYFIVKLIVQATSSTRPCGRCDGKGFWYDARGKEKCDWCKGSGRLPKI